MVLVLPSYCQHYHGSPPVSIVAALLDCFRCSQDRALVAAVLAAAVRSWDILADVNTTLFAIAYSVPQTLGSA